MSQLLYLKTCLSEIKRRNSTIRKKNQCLVTVKLTRQITGSNPTVTLERKDEHKHLHSLEPSFMITKSKHVQELIKKETGELLSRPNPSMQFAVQEQKRVLRFLMLLVEHLQRCKNSLPPGPFQVFKFIFIVINCS